MKLIIDISEEDRKDIGNIHFVREGLKFKIGKAIMNGTPLDDVKAEIKTVMDMYKGCEYIGDKARRDELWHVLEIIDNIGRK